MNCADNDECANETDICDLRLIAQTTRVYSFVHVMKAGKAQDMFALISTNVLLMNIHAIHMVSVPMLMLLSNVPVKLDTLVMVSFALTSMNASKRMPVMLIPLVTILLVVMSAHDTLVRPVMVNPVLIMTNV